MFYLKNNSFGNNYFNIYCCCCSVSQSCPTLCNTMDCSTPGFCVLHHLPELAQTHVHWVGDAIQPSRPLPSLSPLAFNLSQHQGLSPWLGSLHQVAKLLELQLQHQSFQWIFRFNFLGLTGLTSLQSKRLSRVLSLLQHYSLKASSLWCSTLFMVLLSHV